MGVELLPGRGAADDARRSLAVRVRNTGFKAAPQIRLVSTVDGHDTSSYTFDLEAGTEHTLEIPVLVATDQVTRVQIQLNNDGIAADDGFYLALAGEQPVTVLLIGPGPGRVHGSFFINQALALAQAPKFAIANVPVSGLESDLLAEADVVILDDVRLPDDAGRRQLSTFVASGGGLLVVAADGPRGQWPGGDQGFLPGRLGAVVDAESGVGGWAPVNDVHPLLVALREVSEDAFADAEVYRYRNMTATNGDRVLARFDDGAPALMERTNKSGGRVLVMATTLDPRWSSLAFASSFAPFLIETVRYLAHRKRSDSYLWIGEGLDLFAHAGLSKRSRLPANLDQPLSMVVESPAGKMTRLSRDKALYSPDLPGFHELHQARLENNSLPVAVNANRVESNLTTLGAEQFYKEILRPTQKGSEAIHDSTLNRAQTNTGGLWKFVLIIAALLLLSEALLANRLTVRASPLSKRGKP